MSEQLEPLLVRPAQARQIINVGNTKFWQLVRNGTIETVRVGNAPMVVYASLRRLVKPTETS